MPKKLTIEFVKAKTKEIAEGYECLSDEYINNDTKLKFRCGNGHQYEATWVAFWQGQRCPYCSGKKKRTIEEIKEYVELVGYQCLSDIYVNNYTRLKLECDKGHQYEVTWANFLEGHRCPICTNDNKKKTIEEIKEYVEGFEYKCLSDIYVNSKTELKLECDKGHQYEATWANFLGGSRCPYCAGLKKKNIDEIKEYIESFDYKCISDKYVNNRTKLKVQCNKTHIYWTTWAIFKNGNRCPICSLKGRSGKNHPNWKEYSEEDREDIKSYKKYIEKLSNINYKLYKSTINPNNLKRGRNAYHLDHIYSIIDGFNNNVDPNIIASSVNLRMLSEKDNIAKNGTSHMTLEQLYDLHKQFLKEATDG